MTNQDKNVKARVISSNINSDHPILKTQQNLIKKTNRMHDEVVSVDGADVIESVYNMNHLLELADQSSILQQCIDAYKTNITTFGLEVKEKVDTNNLNEHEKAEVQRQKDVLEGYLHYLNTEMPIEEVLEAVQDDIEKTGNGFIEILRDNEGKLATLEYLPVANMRLCKKDERPYEVERMVSVGGTEQKKVVSKLFRRYVQVVGTNKRYFKEYGHPMDLHMDEGTYHESLDQSNRANEVIHFKIGNGTYGKPRWIGNLIGVLGARQSEELNYYYFTNGRHLPAAITVDNGQLDDESLNALTEYMNNATGVKNAHKFLLLEAKGDSFEDVDGKRKYGNTKIDIKSLAQIIQQDALFLDYDERNRNKIRSSFRLPPIYTGETDDYTRATSETSQKVTEEQVFQPERRRLARRLNSVILPELELTKVKLTFRNADFKNPIEIASVLAPFIQAMSVAPNDLRPLLEDLLGIPLDSWEDVYNRPMFAPRGHSEEGIKMIRELDAVAKSAEDEGKEDVALILKELKDVLEESDNEQEKPTDPKY